MRNLLPIRSGSSHLRSRAGYYWQDYTVYVKYLHFKQYLQNLPQNESEKIEAHMQNIGIDTKSIAQPALKRAKSSYTINHFASNQNFVIFLYFN